MGPTFDFVGVNQVGIKRFAELLRDANHLSMLGLEDPEVVADAVDRVSGDALALAH
jgi:hypothetical protein